MAKENTLIHRAQAGDEGAFAALMRAYHTYVYAIIIGIVKNSHDAEEVVQDTFLSAYQGLTQLEDSAKFKSWLAEIARNRARNWLRKQKGDTISIDEVSEYLLQTEDSPDERLIQQEQRELIRRIMETLPQKDRDIARAFYLEGASYNELTSTHGLSDKAISFRLSRAKRQLSKRLQYLLTSIFVPPGLTLKKIYSGDLTIMKVGTAPKITVSAIALIGLIFIGYIGVRQMNAPTVEERVYLSPWEDGTARPRNNPEGLLAGTTQDVESVSTQPQIATAESAAGMESIDDFFDQPDETDMAQFATETEFERDADQDFTIDTSASSESTSQSAEDVMYAFVEAWQNSDFEAMRLLSTDEYMRHDHGDRTSIEVTRDGSPVPPDEISVETLEFAEIIAKSMSKLKSQAQVVSSESVGDEFHFRLRMPAPDIPDISDPDRVIFVSPSYQLIKMQKENGTWQIYEGMPDLDSSMSELPEVPH